jgi:hypothetical protein
VTAPLRLGAFVVLLVVVFVAALVVGRAVGPLDEGDPAPRSPSTPATTTTLHRH